MASSLQGAKEELSESIRVRRTRSGDILVEFKAEVKGSEVALKIKEVTGDKVLVSPLQSSLSLEIRDFPNSGKAGRTSGRI